MSFIFGGVAFYHKDFTLGMVDLSYFWKTNSLLPAKAIWCPVTAGLRLSITINLASSHTGLFD